MKEQGKRFHELDSMRGLAAFVVLLTHVVIIFNPGLLVSATPSALAIYPLLSAHESVIFFFLLSGFVLALPFLNGKSQSYTIYLRRRTLRIYGPYLGALVLAVSGCAIWHNHHPGIADWIPGVWDRPIATGLLVEHILFLGNYPKVYEPAFWSLVHEMRISLIFPFLFLFAAKFRVRYVLLLIAVCTFVGVPNYEAPIVRLLGMKTFMTIEYTGTFLLGILLASHREYLGSVYRRLNVVQRLCLLLASLGLYNGWHLLVSRGPLWHLGDLPIAVGACGFLIIGLNSVLARRILNSALPAFLGRISYSLYLTHEVVLYALLATMSNRISHLLLAAIYLPTAIMLSWVFYLAVEAPFTRLSRSVGKVNVGRVAHI